MKSDETSRYDTRLDVKYKPLELIVGAVQGEYHWHKHDDDDEFFYVVEGELHIDLKERTITLAPRQGVVIPKGVMHRPRAPKRTVMLMVETKSIVPTGD